MILAKTWIMYLLSGTHYITIVKKYAMGKLCDKMVITQLGDADQTVVQPRRSYGSSNKTNWKVSYNTIMATDFPFKFMLQLLPNLSCTTITTMGKSLPNSIEKPVCYIIITPVYLRERNLYAFSHSEMKPITRVFSLV